MLFWREVASCLPPISLSRAREVPCFSSWAAASVVAVAVVVVVAAAEVGHAVAELVQLVNGGWRV